MPGLPDDVRRMLETAPLIEKRLLELGVAWRGLPGGHPAGRGETSRARMAEALRLFVMTWDPLEQFPPRPTGFATVNAGAPGLELVVYVPIWSLVDPTGEWADRAAATLAATAGSAVVTAAAHEQPVTAGSYPAQASRRALPDLLSDPEGGAALGPAELRLVSPEWEDIGLGAITDVVQHGYGPVDLDRSPVELASVAEAHLGCLACAGRRFDFPADLADARDRMCSPHRVEAGKVIQARLARANASNPDGWAALTDASDRLGRPHLPNGLATKLAHASEAMYVVPEPAELATRARLVVEAADWFPGRAGDLAAALGEEPDQRDQLPAWLVNLPLDCGRAGLAAEAVMVGEVLARLDPDNHAKYDGCVALALAEAGHADDARKRIEANLARWPDDLWTQVHAGEGLAALDDVDGARARFDDALEMAGRTDDLVARAEVVERLLDLDRKPAPRTIRHQPSRRPSRSARKRKR